MFKKILDEVRLKEGKKVNLNILIPPSMKVEFDNLCKIHNTTMTAMMLGFIESSLDENPDYSKYLMRELETEILSLEYNIEQTQNYLENVDGDSFDNDELFIRDRVSAYDSLKHYQNKLSMANKEYYSLQRKDELEEYNKIKITKFKKGAKNEITKN